MRRILHAAVRAAVICLCLSLPMLLNAQNAFRERLLPTDANSGFRMDGYWIWCGSVIKADDGKYHMFASRWSNEVSFAPHWLTNSEVVHAVSDTPEGPFHFSDVALPPRGETYWDGRMTHNPAIRKHGDTYLLYYTGTTYHGDMPDAAHPISKDSPKKIEAHRNERIGLAVSKSPYGPWKRFDEPILDVVPNSWEQYLVANPAPFVFDDGRVMLYYKGVEALGKHAVSVAFADHWSGPYKRISSKPLNMGIGAEDPVIWYEEGRFHALMLDHGRKFSDKEIYYASSTDGLKWSIDKNPVAITKEILLADGTTVRRSATERPWVLVEEGKATHAYFATKNVAGDGPDRSWNMCIPLKPFEACRNKSAWFQEAGLGMFVHWGLYSVAAGKWRGEPIADPRYINPYCEHIMLLNQIPLAEYAQLADSFYPNGFDAEALVRFAKRAGMKYLVYTAKHHDGFAMYDSSVSDFNIMRRTSCKVDPLKQLAEACRKEEIRLCIYYSLGRDWAEPDALSREPRRNFWDFPDTTGLSYQRYIDNKVKPQLEELLTRYGSIGMIFFDTPELTTLKQSIDLELFIKRLQPDCIINTRVGNEVGDVVEMSDNMIPTQKSSKPWECPATMAESWGYSELDTKEYWKSADELIEKLVDIRAKGGNYLLNIGPDGSGRIPQEARKRLESMSEWMAVNGEAVCGVTPTDIKFGIHNGCMAQKGDSIYLYVKPEHRRDVLLYVDPTRVESVVMLTPKGERPLKHHAAFGNGICIELPARLPFTSFSVIKVKQSNPSRQSLEIED